jgi:pSer/pThr/pTyr-binding forkhead associated (FHA) protein
MLPASEGGPAVVDAHNTRSRQGSGRQSSGHRPRRQQPFIALQPVSHPDLAPIQIHDSLFAIGRNEAPFDAYPPAMVADLSRRHARIFCEDGAVYLADLGSKNGTTVNGVAVRHAITPLRTGDQLGLGRALSYRVQLEEGALALSYPRAARLASLTLTPERGELGLQPIVVTEFPFMISKVDAAFARYQDSNPAQLNYLSRRHAHIFLKGGQPYLEDLGSTNGSFVDGERLDEHAVALHDGAQVGFGGHHFVYRISLQWEAAAPDPTLTRLGVTVVPDSSPAAPVPASAAAAPAPDVDKTTFVAAPDSFLDIFCVDQPAAIDNEAPDPAGAPAGFDEGGARPHGALAALLAGPKLRSALRWGVAALALVALAAWSLYRIGAPEREVEELLARGAYAQAARVAGDDLARDPRNARLASLATSALLKANLPDWMASLKSGQFARAVALAAAMRRQAGHNAELAPLLDELDWIARLEEFVAARGGAQAAIKGPEDAARIKLILTQWEDQNQAHQRAFETLSSYVPQYRDAYADALSDVRKLALARKEEPQEAQEAHEPATP